MFTGIVVRKFKPHLKSMSKSLEINLTLHPSLNVELHIKIYYNVEPSPV